MGKETGGMALDDATSLSRLKALDSLSALDIQLQEAQKLCNHSARAEMLLRWLVTRLKLSSETRTHPGSWNVFTSCLRLLPVQKITATLSGTVHEILQKTCAERSLPKEVLFAVLRTWELLFDMSQAPIGVAIAALLKVDAVVAAEVCGNWLQHVYRVLNLDESTRHCSDDDLLLLRFGLQLWAARRHSASDDTAFSSNAVLPACQLVVLLRKNNEPGKPKRKRSTHALSTTDDYLRALESLIAKHMALPARTTFLTTQQKGTGRKQSSQTEQAPGKFDALTSTTQDVYEVVPVFLDIALRAVSMPTSGQRSRELPWIEVMFDDLCALVSADDLHQRDQMVAEMLRCLSYHRATLSMQKLSGLAKEALAAPDRRGGINWQMISQIVLLNPGSFTESAISDELFTAIGNRRMTQESGDASFVKDRILVPVLTAFVQKQQMKEFLDLWHRQLLGMDDKNPAEIWISIVPDVVNAISSVPNSDVFFSALTRYSACLQQVVPPRKRRSVENDAQTELGADLVVLRAVLQGTRNISQAPPHLDGLREALLALNATHLSAEIRQELWQLFTVLFELWVPSWVDAQANEMQIRLLLTGLIQSDLVASAVADAQTTSSATLASQVLLGSICSTFQKYDSSDASKTLRTRIVELLCARPESGISVLAEYPNLLEGLSSVPIDDVLQAVVTYQAHAIGHQVTQPHAVSIISPNSPQILRKIISVAKHHEENDDWLNRLDISRSALLSPGLLSTHQRGVVLLKLLSSPAGSESVGQVLAKLLQLLQHPVEDAHLLELVPLLFRWLQPGLVTAAYADLNLLLPTIRAFVRLLPPITGYKAREELSKAVVGMINLLGKDLDQDCNALILLACGTIAALEPIEGTPKETYAHHDKKTLRLLMENLVVTLESTGARLREPLGAANGLLILPNSALDLVGSKWKAYETRIVKTIGNILRTDTGSSNALTVASFKLLCRYDNDADLTKTAIRILSRPLSAKDTRAVFTCFEQSLPTAISTNTIANIISSGSPDSRTAAHLIGSMIKRFWANSAQVSTAYTTNDVWHFLLRTLSSKEDHGIRSEVLTAIETLLIQRKHTINQYSLEQTLTVMQQVVIQKALAEEVFSGVCQVLRVILNQCRTQLQGRFHLVTALFQALLTHLLNDASAAPMQLRERHARNVAHLLELFCKPVWVRSTASNLVDSAREAQKYAGQFVQYILHHYCSQILTSNSAEEVRVAIRPGIFAICEAMEAHDEARIRSLSAAMNANERAILRIVVSDWRAFGKWEGK